MTRCALCLAIGSAFTMALLYCAVCRWVGYALDHAEWGNLHEKRG